MSTGKEFLGCGAVMHDRRRDTFPCALMAVVLRSRVGYHDDGRCRPFSFRLHTTTATPIIKLKHLLAALESTKRLV